MSFRKPFHMPFRKRLSAGTIYLSIVGLCGGLFMVFEVMVSPWGWGISQDLLSVFIWQSGNEVGI